MLQYIKQAKSALSLLSPDEVRRRAELPLVVGLVAETSAAYADMEDFLTPSPVSHAKRIQGMQSVHRASDSGIPSKFDIVLYEQGLPCPATAFTFFRDDPGRTVEEIVKAREDLGLSLARTFYPFRKPVVDRIITTAARENAFFAVASALPNVLPNFLELPWAIGEFASDTAFITMNQVRMAVESAAPGQALLLNLKTESDALYSSYLSEALRLSAAGFGAIIVLLLATLRSPVRVAGVVVPLLLAVLAVAAALLLGGRSLTILHLIGMLLIVAVGSNYALFFDRSNAAEHADTAPLTLASLLIANATTVVGFGVLAFSQVPVLAALGSTVAPGAFLALVFSALLSRAPLPRTARNL